MKIINLVTRRQFTQSALGAAVASALTPAWARIPRGGAIAGGGGGGATPVFSFADFSSAPATVHLAASAEFLGSTIQMCGHPNQHEDAATWFTTKQPPGPFTTQFTFNMSGLGASVQYSGMGFCIQNTVHPPMTSSTLGTSYAGDANMDGYSGAINQYPPIGSVMIKLDAGPGDDAWQSNFNASSSLPSTTGMYFNGGPSMYPQSSIGLIPANDLSTYGINFYSGDTFQVTIVYDGSLLVMVIVDTTTNAQARIAWPLNLANTTNGAGNFVGFVAGTALKGAMNLLSWSYWSGFNTRLAKPTFSPTPGNYTTSQTVTISGPSGAAIYYTTNGYEPTSSSTLYTGPITVAANAVVKAVAIESTFTDSLVAEANFVIGTSSNSINFPSGFVAGNLTTAGWAYLSGSAYRVSDTNQVTAGAAWFPVKVGISSFTTTFAIDWVTSGQGTCYVIQNNPVANPGFTNVQITGTAGQISFNAKKCTVGQYLTASGALTGSGALSGYSSPTSYFVLSTDGISTAQLLSPAVELTQNSVVITGTAGQISFPANTVSVGQVVQILGVNTGTGSIAGFTNPQGLYKFGVTNGSTTGQLVNLDGSAVTTTTGTPVNWVFLVFSPVVSTAGTTTGLTFSDNAFSWSGGPTVVGDVSNSMGYGGIDAQNDRGTANAFGLLNSVAIVFNQFAVGSDPSNGVGLYINGNAPYGSQLSTGLTFTGTFNVTLTYSGTSLSISMQKSTGGTIFTHTFTIDIPATVGGSSAYAGFTGGAGGAAGIAAITNWVHT